MTPRKRYSKQREEILEAVRNSQVHPTAERIYEEVREEIPSLSLGTVYRNLNLLTDEGKIREVILDDNIKRYDGNLDDHYHCICNSCGRIYDVSLDAGPLLDELANQIENFKVESHEIEFHGTCDECDSGMDHSRDHTPD